MKTLIQTLEALASVAGATDSYTAGHQHRVSQLSAAISLEMRNSKEKIELAGIAAIIQDLGEINIPSELLAKPGNISMKLCGLKAGVSLYRCVNIIHAGFPPEARPRRPHCGGGHPRHEW